MQAQLYHKSPSELVGIPYSLDNSFLIYQFNLAVEYAANQKDEKDDYAPVEDLLRLQRHV